MPGLKTSNNPQRRRVRLSAEQLAELFRLARLGLAKRELAKKFRVSESWVSQVVDGPTPRYLEKAIESAKVANG
jgi:Mor family transcriptional regulator